MNLHEKYINRCIELAKNGLGTTYPNPLVGSVIVYNDKIIGEGWHKKAGESHAEVNAINSVKDKSLLSKATIYVSLEPCSHFGKTPPCSDLIIYHKIPNVVIGTVDPNEKVAGKGIKKLLVAGTNITVGVLEEKCHELNKRFFTFHNKKRPFIILKWAETADGFIAPDEMNKQLSHDELKPFWITNSYSRQLVHKMRSEEQAILVGTNTVLIDNPKLNTRNLVGNCPVRVILDRNNKITSNYYVKDNSVQTIFITEIENLESTENCIYEVCKFDDELIFSILKIAHKHNVQSIIIEGGTKTIQSFIDAKMWDEAFIFKGKNIFKNGIKAPVIKGKSIESKQIIDDELLILQQSDRNDYI